VPGARKRASRRASERASGAMGQRQRTTRRRRKRKKRKRTKRIKWARAGARARPGSDRVRARAATDRASPNHRRRTMTRSMRMMRRREGRIVAGQAVKMVMRWRTAGQRRRSTTARTHRPLGDSIEVLGTRQRPLRSSRGAEATATTTVESSQRAGCEHVRAAKRETWKPSRIRLALIILARRGCEWVLPASATSNCIPHLDHDRAIVCSRWAVALRTRG
jgi:hypothetical protein